MQVAEEQGPEGLRRLRLTGEALEVELLPELGGKLVALRRRASGRNVLLEPPEHPYRPAHPGADFSLFDTSGWDECFPCVGPGPSPDVPGLALPDHGEVWSQPWTWRVEGEALVTEARGLHVPSRFERRLTLQGETLRLDYAVHALGPRPLRYLWSVHPLLAVSPGSRVVLPAEVTSVQVEGSADLGPHGTHVPWPRAPGGRALDLLAGPGPRLADKLFTPPLRQGACALHDAASDESVTFRFDPARLPHVGLWLCQGGWPGGGRPPHFTAALEPCTAPADALDARSGRWLQPGGTERWWLEVALRAGPPNLKG
jgi:galactose mutarotase-like enzyme